MKSKTVTPRISPNPRPEPTSLVSAALRESQDRLALATMAAELGIWDWDILHDIAYLSPKYYQMTGYTQGEVRPGREFFEALIVPADLPVVRKTLEDHLKGRSPYSVIEYRMRRKSGELRWIRGVGRVVARDRKGAPLRMAGVIIDITEQKEAESVLVQARAQLEQRVAERTAALEESEQKLTLAMAAAQMGSWLLDLESGRFEADHTCRLLHGFTAEEPASSLDAICRYVHPEDATELKRRFQRAVHSHGTYQNEYRVVSPDGRMRWLAALGKVQRQASLLIGIVQDITAQKAAELTRARLAAIVESSTDAITAADLNGLITTWMPSAERLYGYSAAEAIGQPLAFIVPPDRQNEIAWFSERLKCGEQIAAYETVRVCKGGKHILVSITVSPVRDMMGRLVGLSSISRDITEKKLLERQLLEVSEREQQRLAHDLHDGLSQELQAVFYLSKLLEAELQQELPARAAEVARLARVLEHALQLMRNVARGLQPVNPVPEGLMAALAELAERTRELYQVECRFECPKTVFIPRHNVATHLFRIAQEAVNNAMKHGRPSRIVIQLWATAQKVSLEIQDNGKGIRRQKAPSSGMGLHIMRQRAEAIRGKLLIQRGSHGGTEVLCTVERQQLRSEPNALS